MRTGDVAIRVRDLSVRYGTTSALSGVDLDLPARRVSAVMGPSGSGKSTFLAALNRLTDLIPGCRAEGRIWIGGKEVSGTGVDVRALRTRVGMIFQRPNPFPLSIRRNVELPLREHGVRSPAELAERLEGALRDVGLWEEVKDRLDRPALGLSGGQQQRLCLARALALRPEILLLDEPASSLDPMASRVVEELIRKLRARYTVVVVTHDLAQARRLADHAVLFWREEGYGRLVESGPAECLFRQPRDEITRAYLQGELG